MKRGKTRYGYGSSSLLNIPKSFKDYMKKVNDEFEPLTVVNKNPDEDIAVLSKSEWDSIQETLRIAQNKELSDKVLRGMAQVRAGSTQVHVIEE